MQPAMTIILQHKDKILIQIVPKNTAAVKDADPIILLNSDLSLRISNQTRFTYFNSFSLSFVFVCEK